MKRNGQTQREIEALGDLVDRYGADRTRWPAPDRLRFASLLKDSAEARELLSEAAAFDRLLDMAPTASADRRAALADRIVAAALTTQTGRPSEYTADGVVTDLGAARSARRPASRPAARWGSSAWQAAALLAASLVLGIFAGSSGMLPVGSFGLSSTASASDVDFEGRVLALGPDVGSLADEDTL